MRQLFLSLILLIGVTQATCAMEESKKTFLTAEFQKAWIEGIIQMLTWSLDLPNRYQNKMICAYQNCYNKISQLQEDGKSDILQEFPEETAFAEQLLPQLINEKDIIKKLKTILASHKINFPSDLSKQNQEWQKKSNQALLAMNEKTSATSVVIIAGSLIPYKIAELRKNNKKK